MNDPILQIRDLLLDELDDTNLSYTGNVRIHTGWYDYDSGTPQITVTNKNEFTVDGGETAISAGTGDGGAVQKRAGTVLVNGWSGTRNNLTGQGPAGDDVNPKQMAYELGKEIARITLNGDIEDFLSVAPDTIRGIAEDDAPEIVFREECTVRYTYVRRE